MSFRERPVSVKNPFTPCPQSLEHDGVHFEKGALVAMATPLAGRAPMAFPEPHVFDPERGSQTRHVAFGRGYTCASLNTSHATSWKRAFTSLPAAQESTTYRGGHMATDAGSMGPSLAPYCL